MDKMPAGVSQKEIDYSLWSPNSVKNKSKISMSTTMMGCHTWYHIAIN